MNDSRADYGVDAPTFLAASTIVGLLMLLLSVALFLRPSGFPPVLASARALVAFLAAYLLLMAGHFVWSSRIGKRRALDRLLDSVGLRGDETILDVGCGRGLLLLFPGA